MADYGLIGGLASGAQGFMQGMNDAQDRKYRRLEHDARMRSMENEVERKAFQEALELKKAGLARGEGGAIVDAPRGQRQMGDIQLEAATKGLSPTFNEAGEIVDVSYMPEYMTIKTPAARPRGGGGKGLIGTTGGISSSPIPGFQKSESYRADRKEERELLEGYNQVSNFDKILVSLRNRVSSADPRELANPISNTSKDIKNDLRDLQLIYKKKSFADLGVLAGPDLRLLEDIIENPGSVSNLISGKAGVLKRYDQVRNKVNSAFQDRAQSYGLVPEGAMKTGLIPESSGGESGQNSAAQAKLRRLEELRRKAAGQ